MNDHRESFDSNAIPLSARPAYAQHNTTPIPSTHDHHESNTTSIAAPPLPRHESPSPGVQASPPLQSFQRHSYMPPGGIGSPRRSAGVLRTDPNAPDHYHQYSTPPPYIPYPPAPPPGNVTTRPYGNKRGVFKRMLLGPNQRPWFSWLSALAMLIVLIVEFVRNNQMTGSVIQTNPINPMIGPNFMVLVNLGARFTPCMRPIPGFTPSTPFADCFRTVTDTCSLETLCGFDGFDGKPPNQSFRFVTPIFMHAGIVHFLMNMLTHLRLGIDLERALGLPRYVILYMASGVWGFVLSAMLASAKSASMGCSGALFGLIGYMFIDIIVNWKIIPHPIRDLMSLLVSTIISLVLGLLPGLDNFAHIGGFVVGILMGIAIAPMRPGASKRIKIATWIARAIAVGILAMIFVVTIRQFYSVSDPAQICPGCKYISCLPVNNWCDM